MTYDLTTPVGQVRFLLNDVDRDNQIFTDPELAAVISLARGKNVKRAAAMVIDVNASNEVLASKVLRSQDVATDGAKAAAELRKHAAQLRTDADEDDDAADEGFFTIVPVSSGHSPELTQHQHFPGYWP